jgi:hypothetical protein
MPVIGWLGSDSREQDFRVVPFRQGLKQATSRARTWRSSTAGRRDNWIDCQRWPPIWFVVRWSVIAVNGLLAARAAKAATATIPIVFEMAADPVQCARQP